MITWRIAEGVAWVGDAERVALIDTRKGAAAMPMHVHAPFSELWAVLAQGPATEDDLRGSAVRVAGDDAGDFLRAFIDPLSGARLIEGGHSG